MRTAFDGLLHSEQINAKIDLLQLVLRDADLVTADLQIVFGSNEDSIAPSSGDSFDGSNQRAHGAVWRVPE